MNRFSEQKFLVIGRPMRVTHNQEIPLAMSKKDKIGGRNSQETLRVPFPLVMGPIFAGRGRVISGSLANRLGSRFGTNSKLLCGIISPISARNDQLNTVFDDVVRLRGRCRNKRPSHGPHGNSSLLACGKSFLTKEYAIYRSPRQIETYSLAMDC